MNLRPKRLAAAVVAVALAAPALIGTAPAVSAKGGRGAPSYLDLNKVPKPKITGAEIITGLEEYVNKFPMRHNGLPNNIAAAQFLADEAKKYGFKVTIREFEVSGRTVRVVEALKAGTTKPDEWISFISHYDVVAGGGFTVQGAYDDGSGTNMMRYFGKAFSKLKTNRTIALLWFDAEENGLLASQAYAEYVKKKKQKIQAALGFDMVGIGYPARYCICIYHGHRPEDMAIAKPIIDHVNFKYLKYPKGDGGPGATQKWPLGTEGHVCDCGQNIRNSDEQNLGRAGYFSLRWTGMRTALDYPGYHQAWDTVPFMELVAGGRENLEKGTENTFVSAYYTAFVLDNMPYLGGPTK